MGCDYRIWVETVIQYRDANGIIQSEIEGEEPQRKWNIYPEDTDFEEVYNLDAEIREYGKKVIYQDGVWRCLPQGKMRIQEICYERKIPFDSILYVFKFKNGYT